MLGWYSQYNTTAATILSSIDTCSIVYYYDAAAGMPTIVTPNSPPENDFVVSCGMGLFVAVSTESDWLG
jgi:hypothetical protein